MTIGHDELVRLATAGCGNRRVAFRVLRRVVNRRNWAVHRHVHLVAALETALAVESIDTVLSVGCGSGLTELFLAVSHPEVHFTLAELDLGRFAWTRQMADAWAIDNVTFATHDLLAPSAGPLADFVASIEVLEHIEDDQTAARNLVACARRFLYLLVPYCSAAELGNPGLAARMWERHEHHRVGYTRATFDALLGDHERLIDRNCYLLPEAIELRARLGAMSDDEVAAARNELVRAAADDVQNRLVEGGSKEAQGIEALLRLDGLVDP